MQDYSDFFFFCQSALLISSFLTNLVFVLLDLILSLLILIYQRKEWITVFFIAKESLPC